jgi:hypothetical protein
MRLRDIYETVYRVGIAADPRGEDGVARVLARTPPSTNCWICSSP